EHAQRDAGPRRQRQHGLRRPRRQRRRGQKQRQEDGAQGHQPLASCMARHTFCAVAGIATSLTPSGASASMMAFITTGMAPTVPASPAPLAPSGLYWVGTGLLLISMLHIVSARGMA